MNLRKPDELLKQSMARLEHVLASKAAGREYQWSASVADALGQVREAMDRRPADPTSTTVDDTRPTLARQADELRQTFSDCLVRAESLHLEIKRVAHQFAPKARAKVRDQAGGIPDFTDIRQRAADLLSCLQNVREDEANLVLESVNTDIGVGD
jgi:ABC-type transporter Mla subunit MlaD